MDSMDIILSRTVLLGHSTTRNTLRTCPTTTVDQVVVGMYSSPFDPHRPPLDLGQADLSEGLEATAGVFGMGWVKDADHFLTTISCTKS